MIIDVQGQFRKFLDENWAENIGEIDHDICALHAVDGRDFVGNRVDAVRDWLRSYQVFQSLTTAQRNTISSNLIEFHDLKPCRRLGSAHEILAEFGALATALRQNGSLFKKNGEPRKIESLTSKALWLCYPFDIPILDDFAESALRVIARSGRVTSTNNSSRYATFVDVWFKIYEPCRFDAHAFGMESGAYPVRVFDRFLWWLGQDSYVGIVNSAH